MTADNGSPADSPEVTVVIPCLNEADDSYDFLETPKFACSEQLASPGFRSARLQRDDEVRCSRCHAGRAGLSCRTVELLSQHDRDGAEVTETMAAMQAQRRWHV